MAMTRQRTFQFKPVPGFEAKNPPLVAVKREFNEEEHEDDEEGSPRAAPQAKKAKATGTAAAKGGGAKQKATSAPKKQKGKLDRESRLAAVQKTKGGSAAVREMSLLVPNDLRALADEFPPGANIQALKGLASFCFRRAMVRQPWFDPEQREIMVKIVMPGWMSMEAIDELVLPMGKNYLHYSKLWRIAHNDYADDMMRQMSESMPDEQVAHVLSTDALFRDTIDIPYADLVTMWKCCAPTVAEGLFDGTAGVSIKSGVVSWAEYALGLSYIYLRLRMEAFWKAGGFLVSTGGLELMKVAEMRNYWSGTGLVKQTPPGEVPPMTNYPPTSQKEWIAFHGGKDSEEDKGLIEVIDEQFKCLENRTHPPLASECASKAQELEGAKKYSQENLEAVTKDLDLAPFVLIEDEPMPVCEYIHVWVCLFTKGCIS